MVEKDNFSPEQRNQNPEALKNEGAERSAELAHERDRNAAEKRDEQSSEKLQENAERLAEVKHEKSAEKGKAKKVERGRSTSASKRAQANSFKKTMQETQAHMSPASRSFSKLIHNRAVEKTSEVAGATVARPNAILAGAVSAFLFTLVIYIVARRNGYPLSGFESIASFILGWIVGLMFDYIRVMITGKRA